MEPSCPWRDEPVDRAGGTNDGVRSDGTIPRWRRSKTVADSAVRGPNPCHPCNPCPKLRWCDDSVPLRFNLRWLRRCDGSNEMRCLCAALCLCASVVQLRCCDDSNPMRWIRVIREIRVQEMRCLRVRCLCVFLPSWLRRCDGAMNLSASICAICGLSSAMSLCATSLCLCASVVQLRWCDESVSSIQIRVHPCPKLRCLR